MFNSGALPRPTADLVRAACITFEEQGLYDEALTTLFEFLPGNSDLHHVLLKVVSVNALYSTQIYALEAVARHIHENAAAIDAGLAAGSPAIIEKIAKVTIGSKERVNLSFATKYCSWHRPALFPIYDSYVDKYLWALQQQDHFSGLVHHYDLWDYLKFCDVIREFRVFYGLDAFNFKDIDKFLWSQGFALTNSNTATTLQDQKAV